MVESELPERAVKMYMRAGDIYEVRDTTLFYSWSASRSYRS